MSKKPITVKALMAGDFPPAVRPFWENVPSDKNLRDALVLTAIVCYCGLAPRLRVKYTYDNAMLLSMLLLDLLVIGPSGSGKSAIRWAVNLLMNAQILRDTEEGRRLREYKEMSKKELGTPVRTFIFKWLKKKWIYEVEKDVYEKLY